MTILMWVTFGVVAGSFARRVMNGPAAGGIAVAIALGVVGGVVGGLVGNFALYPGASGELNRDSLLPSLAGAIFVLFCYRSYAMRGAE